MDILINNYKDIKMDTRNQSSEKRSAQGDKSPMNQDHNSPKGNKEQDQKTKQPGGHSNQPGQGQGTQGGRKY